MTKEELLQVVENQKQEIENQKQEIERLNYEISQLTVKADDYEKLKLKYDVLVNARKEDAGKTKEAVDKIKEAESVLASQQTREKELNAFYQRQMAQIKKDVDGQNELIVTLFTVNDQTLGLLNNQYENFKKLFIAKKEE